MKTDELGTETPNKLAKWVLADCLQIADYISDDAEYQDGRWTGYVRGVKIDMSDAEWQEMHRFIDKHRDAVLKRWGQ